MKCVLMGIAVGMFDRRRSSPLKSENAMNLDNRYLKIFIWCCSHIHTYKST